jgi:hypothetical protein
MEGEHLATRVESSGVRSVKVKVKNECRIGERVENKERPECRLKKRGDEDRQGKVQYPLSM